MTPHVDEVTWVTDQRPDVLDPDGPMTDRARMALVAHMSADAARPRRRLPWLAGAGAIGVAAAAAVAIVVATGGSGTPHAGPGSSAAAPLAAKPSYVLLNLAHDVSQAPALPGDATLVKRSTDIVDPGQSPTSYSGYDLFEDGGSYYYGETLAALRSAVSDPSSSDAQSASLGHVVAAAAASASSTPAQAAATLLAANAHPTPQVGEGTPPLTQAEADRDLEGIEWAAIDSALEGGAGRPEVRAGALLAASAMPNTTVTSTTQAGAPVDVITWTSGPNSIQRVVVNSQTGVLLDEYVTGGVGGSTSNTTYQVSRVTTPGLDPAN